MNASPERLQAHEVAFLELLHSQQEVARVLEPLGLNLLKVGVLSYLELRPRHPKDLAALLQTSAPAVSVLLNELTQRGLVRRGHERTDKRLVRLELTSKGRSVLAQLKGAWQARETKTSTDCLETQ